MKVEVQKSILNGLFFSDYLIKIQIKNIKYINFYFNNL